MFSRKSADKNLLRYYIFDFLINLRFFSAILVPFFTQGAGLSLFEVQTLQSWYLICIFIFELPTGVVADYLGRKYILGLGAFVLAAAVLVFGNVHTFQGFLIAELLYGLAISLISGPDKAFIYDTLKESHNEKDGKRVFGLNYSISLIALFLSGSVSGAIATHYNLQAPMILSIFPFVLAGIFILTAREPFQNKKKESKVTYREIISEGFAYLFKHKLLKLLALDAIIISSVTYFILWLYPSLLKKMDVPIMWYGFVYTLLFGSAVFVSTHFAAMERWAGGARRYFRVSALITALSFILVGVFPNIVTLIIYIILAGGFGFTRFELMSVYMNNHISSKERATILSFIYMVRRIVLVILNPIIGFMATKSLSFSLIILGIISLTVFLLPRQKTV